MTEKWLLYAIWAKMFFGFSYDIWCRFRIQVLLFNEFIACYWIPIAVFVCSYPLHLLAIELHSSLQYVCSNEAIYDLFLRHLHFVQESPVNVDFVCWESIVRIQLFDVHSPSNYIWLNLLVFYYDHLTFYFPLREHIAHTKMWLSPDGRDWVKQTGIDR